MVGQAEASTTGFPLLKDWAEAFTGVFTYETTTALAIEGVCEKGESYEACSSTEWIQENVALVKKNTHKVKGKVIATGVELIGWDAVTYILTWNPRRWHWEEADFDAKVERTRRGELTSDRWSCGNTRRIVAGDRLFLLRQAIDRGLVTVNSYERNPAARLACITHYGARCVVCGFDFGDVYGNIGQDYIHVHHLRDLASIGTEY